MATAVLVIAMSACNEKKSKDSIIGSWIMPIEGQPGKMQGIKLEEGGDASSINMATLVYKYWEYNPQIQISAESETKRSIFREKDKTKRSKKESAQHSKSRNKSFVMTSVSAL